MTNRVLLRAVLAVAVIAFLSYHPAAAVNYTITDLGTLGGTQSSANAINNHGVVVGFAQNTDGYQRAFLWDRGPLENLGTLGGNRSWAFDINDAGIVVGSADDAEAKTKGFLLNGTIQELVFPGGRVSSASAVDAYGHVAGESETATQDAHHAFLYDGSAVQDLGTLGPGQDSSALGMNDSGQIVGKCSAGDWSRAVLWEDNEVTDLGTFAYVPGSLHNSAWDINASGQIVGKAMTESGEMRAFLYESSMREVGDLGIESGARSINDAGTVVGHVRYAGDVLHPFLYDGSTMIDLNDLLPSGSDWELSTAHDINDVGQIVGGGWIGGEQHAFLMELPGEANGDAKVDGADLAIWQANYDPLGLNTNTFAMGDWDNNGCIDGADLALWQQNYDPLGPGLTEAVPEPGTMLLLGTGALCFAGFMRRRLMS